MGAGVVNVEQVAVFDQRQLALDGELAVVFEGVRLDSQTYERSHRLSLSVLFLLCHSLLQFVMLVTDADELVALTFISPPHKKRPLRSRLERMAIH